MLTQYDTIICLIHWFMFLKTWRCFESWQTLGWAFEHNWSCLFQVGSWVPAKYWRFEKHGADISVLMMPILSGNAFLLRWTLHSCNCVAFLFDRFKISIFTKSDCGDKKKRSGKAAAAAIMSRGCNDDTIVTRHSINIRLRSQRSPVLLLQDCLARGVAAMLQVKGNKSGTGAVQGSSPAMM